MEKELLFGCCSPPPPALDITTCFYQGSWDLWNGHFSFSFFLPVAKSSIHVQGEFSAGKPPSRRLYNLCGRLLCSSFSVSSTPWMQESFCAYDGRFPTPACHCLPTSLTLHPPSGYHRNARNRYPEIMPNRNLIGMISGSWDKQTQRSSMLYLALFMAKFIQIYRSE